MQEIIKSGAVWAAENSKEVTNIKVQLILVCWTKHFLQIVVYYILTRSLGALRAPTSSWRPFGPLDFVLRALRALRPYDPRIGDWIVF